MDSPRQPKGGNYNREAKRSQNHSSARPQKDAYARLLSQHHSSKFRSYLEEYAQQPSFQGEENGPSAPPRAHSDRLDVPQRKRDQAFIEFSDSSDYSPSPMKSKEEESCLSLYMEKLNSRGARQDCDRKQGVFDRQRRGERRDTATSHDGDVESGEELGALKPRDSQQHQKQQRKNKDHSRDHATNDPCHQDGVPPRKTCYGGQEQEKKKSKKKNVPKNHEEEKRRDGVIGPEVDAEMFTPKSPHSKSINMQQAQGK